MIPSLTVTTICENTVPYPGNNLLGEHGLAMLVEVRGNSFLFDTGGGLTILNNSQNLSIDLNRLKAVILSHGHHDHTGGGKTAFRNEKRKGSFYLCTSRCS